MNARFVWLAAAGGYRRAVLDPAPMDTTQSLPVEDERLRVYPDGSVEHERIRRGFARMPDPFADFWARACADRRDRRGAIACRFGPWVVIAYRDP